MSLASLRHGGFSCSGVLGQLKIVLFHFGETWILVVRLRGPHMERIESRAVDINA